MDCSTQFSGGVVLRAGLVAVGGTWTVWAIFTDQGGEGLGHQGSGKPAVDINHGQGLQTHTFQGPERATQSGGVCG